MTNIQFSPISKDFRRAILEVSQYEFEARCTCGREFYDGSFDDEDDYVGPGSYMERVRTVRLNNQTFVVDCPCNGLRRFEEWTLANKEWILDFFVKDVTTKQKEVAQYYQKVFATGAMPEPIRQIEL